MSYRLLKEFYYSDKPEYEKEYADRFGSPYARHLDFDVHGYPAFFLITPDIHEAITKILRMDRRVQNLKDALPGKATEQFSMKCLIDEIMLTNSIEGVHSTRREISDIIQEMDKAKNTRFNGLVKKYWMLTQNSDIPIRTCEDIRKIYDELVLPEVLEDDPANKPDGKIFRASSVSVRSPRLKTIHTGLYPEEKIISAMEKALACLHDESEDLLCRIAVFHYMLGYIHPFYDGNGRLNRFISSYMITKELSYVLCYRLSYTIKENITAYYKAFDECNQEYNRGDLTPFVIMFMNILLQATEKLIEALSKRLGLFRTYSDRVRQVSRTMFPGQEQLLDLLMQAKLFSSEGISMQDLCIYMERSRETIRKQLKVIDDRHLLLTKYVGRYKFYKLDLDAVDALIHQSP